MTGSVFKKLMLLFDGSVRKNVSFVTDWPTEILVVISALTTVIATLLAIQFISDSWKAGKGAAAYSVSTSKSKDKQKESLGSFRIFQVRTLLSSLQVLTYTNTMHSSSHHYRRSICWST